MKSAAVVGIGHRPREVAPLARIAPAATPRGVAAGRPVFSYLVVNVHVYVVDPAPVFPTSGLPAASRTAAAPPVTRTV